jgi:hypothetical protein
MLTLKLFVYATAFFFITVAILVYYLVIHLVIQVTNKALIY